MAKRAAAAKQSERGPERAPERGPERLPDVTPAVPTTGASSRGAEKPEKAEKADRVDKTERTDKSGKSAGKTLDGARVDEEQLVRRHLAFGWWALAIFSGLGLILEAAHGLKLGWYLDVTSATRRLSLTLGHAHGTLLGFINLAFAMSLRHARLSAVGAARASFALRAATVLMPLGFFLGGLVFYAGDPGFGIALVPPSAVLLVFALVLVARGFAAPR